MKKSDKEHAKRHIGEPAAPRMPQREDQPLKQINEDPDALPSDVDDNDGLPPDSGKYEGRDPVLREDHRKSTEHDS